jgi:hypothetical protein
MKAQLIKPKLPKADTHLGPEFLTFEDFKEAAMRKNPRWVEHRFAVAGIALPDALVGDLNKLKALEDRMHTLTGNDYQAFAGELYGEMFPFWVRLQQMGFSPEIVHVELLHNCRNYYVPKSRK